MDQIGIELSTVSIILQEENKMIVTDVLVNWDDNYYVSLDDDFDLTY